MKYFNNMRDYISKEGGLVQHLKKEFKEYGNIIKRDWENYEKRPNEWYDYAIPIAGGLAGHILFHNLPTSFTWGMMISSNIKNAVEISKGESNLQSLIALMETVVVMPVEVGLYFHTHF